jgi:hypothetical protein
MMIVMPQISVRVTDYTLHIKLSITENSVGSTRKYNTDACKCFSVTGEYGDGGLLKRIASMVQNPPSKHGSRSAGQESPAFYGTRMFITVLTRARNSNLR